MHAFKRARHSNIAEDDYYVAKWYIMRKFFSQILDFGKQSVIAMVSIKK